MSRREKLTELIGADSLDLLSDVVDEVMFLEDKLKELKVLPFINVNPQNPAQQKATPAAKQYKEFLQQYVNCIKLIESVIYRDKRLDGEEVEESPLRKWFNQRGV